MLFRNQSGFGGPTGVSILSARGSFSGNYLGNLRSPHHASLQMPDSLEDKLKAVSAEVASLEQQIDKIQADNEIRIAAGSSITLARRFELEELERKLNSARQRQLSLLLTSISGSSNRLETVTKNLKETSESQVKIAESQVKVSESQAQAIRDLLRSSHRLEQFTLFLIIIGALNVFIVEQSIAPSDPTIRTVWLVASIVAILALTVYAYRWPRLRKDKPTDKNGS